MRAEEIFDGIFRINGKIATRNLTKGRKVYGEELVQSDGTEYRMWNPYRSKLCAAIIKGIKEIHISDGDNVLYLGTATGTTASHVSDIIGKKGHLFGVEISERNMRDLVRLCEHRTNMMPILADAEHPEEYLSQTGKCDIIYQDISAKNQGEILVKNSTALKAGGYAYLVIKSQSIDISRDPREIYKEELSKVGKKFEIVEKTELDPYDSMHLFVVLRKLD